MAGRSLRAAAVLLVLTAAGCGNLGSVDGGVPRGAGGGAGGVGGCTALVFAVGAEPGILDPHNAVDNPTGMVLRHIYETLVAFNENMEIVPQLAESWSVSADGLTWTFRLRPGVVFHDGVPLDAAAVAASFHRLLSAESGVARGSLFRPFVRAVEAVGPLEVRFRLLVPFAALLHHLAHGAAAVISPALLAAGPEAVALRPAGTGPFQLISRRPGSALVLERVERYWGGRPGLELLEFRVVSDDAARVLLLESGDVDAAYPLPVVDVARLEARPDIRVRRRPTQRVIYVGMNLQRPELQDIRVRRAFNLAVNREALVERLLLGLGEPARGVLAPGTFGFHPYLPYPYDPEAAARLLAEAGIPRGRPLELWSPEGRYPMDRQVAEAVQNFLATAGQPVRFRTWEWGAYLGALSRRHEPDWDLFLLGWAPTTGDADWFLRPLFFSGSNSNHSFYRDARVDDLLLAAISEPRMEARADLYALVQERVADAAPWIFLYTMEQSLALRAGLEGETVLPVEIIDFREARPVAGCGRGSR